MDYQNLNRFQQHRMVRGWLAAMTGEGGPLYPELRSAAMPINEPLAAELAKRGMLPTGDLWGDVGLAMTIAAGEVAQ